MKKHLIFILLLGIFNTSVLHAQQETRYIRDILYVAIRESQDNGSEIVRAGLTSGTPLKLLEETSDGVYSRVATADGEQGWIQTQYLSEEPAAKDLLDQARARAAAMEKERNELAASYSELETRFAETSNKLDQLSQHNKQQMTELERVKSLSGNAVQLDREYKQLLSEKQALENRMLAITTENSQLKSRMENNDFLNGALAVFLGVIITLVVPRLWPSRRKSEWV